MTEEYILEKITQEIQNARKSQFAGNDGLARVCARRAAGWAIQEYLSQQGQAIDSPSALDHIKYLSSQSGFSDQISQALKHLTIKMEKDSLDEEAYYPIADVDLVSEAILVVEELLQVKLTVN